VRFLKNKCFHKNLKEYGLDDGDIKVVLDDVLKGRAMSLGSKMYKIRSAQEGKGKSGSFRNIFFWKKNEFIIFCLLFAKNEQENMSPDEKKSLRILSNEYSKLTENEVQGRIEKRSFWEIEYDKDPQ
jgi:hypothetical protein